MELLMDTEELVSVRPVLPSAPSSSCALTAALTGTRGTHRENTHTQRSMSEHSQSRAFHRGTPALMFCFHFGWPCTGQSLRHTPALQLWLLSFPSSSQQNTEISTPLHRFLPTLSLSSVLDVFNRSLDAIWQIKEGLFHEFTFSPPESGDLQGLAQWITRCYHKEFTTGTKKPETPQQPQVTQSECGLVLMLHPTWQQGCYLTWNMLEQYFPGYFVQQGHTQLLKEVLPLMVFGVSGGMLHKQEELGVAQTWVYSNRFGNLAAGWGMGQSPSPSLCNTLDLKLIPFCWRTKELIRQSLD